MLKQKGISNFAKGALRGAENWLKFKMGLFIIFVEFKILTNEIKYHWLHQRAKMVKYSFSQLFVIILFV
jgi:hypothetical protein